MENKIKKFDEFINEEAYKPETVQFSEDEFDPDTWQQFKDNAKKMDNYFEYGGVYNGYEIHGDTLIATGDIWQNRIESAKIKK